MNAKTLIAAAALFAAAGTVFAADDSSTATATAPAAAAVSTVAKAAPVGRTRAEVIAEVVAARKAGTLIETEADLDVAQTRKQIAK